MKKIILLVSAILCFFLGGCKRYDFTEKLYTTDNNIQKLVIEELDTPIIVEITNENREEISIKYFESVQETYEFDLDHDVLKIEKSDSANGRAFFLSGDDSSYDELVLKITIAKGSINELYINAQESSVEITGGEIDNLYVKTSYEPIELNDVTILENFTGITKYDSIRGTIIGDPADFSVSTKVEEGINSLQEHNNSGEIELNLETKEGDINITFIEN